MIRTRLTLCGLLISLASPALAHFPWLVPNPKEGRVEVYFGESAEPDDPDLLDRLKGIVVVHRAADGTLTEHEAVRKDDWLGVPTKSFDGTYAADYEYGLLTRGDDTFLLQYGAKAYTGRPRKWTEFEKPVSKLDVIPSRQQGRFTVEVHFDGKPLAGAEVVVDTPDLDRVKGETDAKGRFSVESKASGRFAARAKHVEERSGKRGGKSYDSVRHYTTLTAEVGGPASKPKSSAEAGSKSAGLPDLPTGLTSFGAAVLDGKVYVYGGHMGTAHEYYKEGQSDELFVLDLAKPGKGWKVVGQVPRRQGLALVPHGGHLYRVGGFEARNAEGEDRDLASTADFARFDPKTGKWESLVDLPEPRSSHDAVVIGDKLYVAGGWAMGDGESKWHETALVADLSADEIRWEKLPEPPFKRRALSLGEANGRLYVIGGMQEEGGPTTKVGVYDPKTKSWSEGPAILAEGRMGGFGASAFRCGKHLYVSTYDGSLQRLDENDGKWVEVAELEHPRFFHRMLPVSGNRLLVLGGASMQSGKVLELETFDVER